MDAQLCCDAVEPLCRADIADLYAQEATRVRRLVALSVTAPAAAVEDACQVAWLRLLRDPARVRRETAVRWLIRVASREVLHGVQRASRDLSLEAVIAERGQIAAPPQASADSLAEQRGRLEAIDELPERQQRLVWLRGLGFSYAEMADETGDSLRTVERQLERARDRLTEAGAL